MASTMAIPQMATIPTFHPAPMAGPMPGAIPGNFPPHVPVTVHAPMLSGPLINGNNSPNAALNQPPIPTIRLPIVPVGGGCYNDGMEVVWHGEFSRLFSSFFPPHVWYLSITNAAPQEKWKYFRDSAKVRFCCQDCGNGWTSMKGRVTFWFHLNTATNEGFVQFKLYGQVCKKCNSGKFEYVMWYPEEVSKVMCNLYNKVGQTFYGFMQPPIRIDRRPGRPRNQHNAELCQACRDGECDQGRPMKAMFNYLPPDNRMPNPQIRPVVNPQMPIVIRQPPLSHTGHVVMQGPPQSLATSAPSHLNAPNFIAAPVNLTSGVQPVLTYSVVTTSVQDENGVSKKDKEDAPSADLQKNHDTALHEKKVEKKEAAKSTPYGENQMKSMESMDNKSKSVGNLPTDEITSLTEKIAATSVTSELQKPKCNGAAATLPLMEKSPSFKKSTNSDNTKESDKIKPVINGYASAARKSLPKGSQPNGIPTK